MILSGLQNQSPIASLLKRNFLYSCAAVDRILASRTGQLRQLSFFLQVT